jgi:pyruvate carboxylase
MLMMVSQNLTRAQVAKTRQHVSFPDSVVDMMRGNLWPNLPVVLTPSSKKVLKDEKPNLTRPEQTS